MDNLYIALWQFANGFLRFALVMIIGVLILKIVFIPIKRMLMKSKVDHTAKTFLFSLIRVILYGIVVITEIQGRPHRKDLFVLAYPSNSLWYRCNYRAWYGGR